MSDFLIDLLRDILIGATADQIRDFLAKILSGDDIFSLASGGNDFAAALVTGFADAGIDPGQLSDAHWGELAELMLPAMAARG